MTFGTMEVIQTATVSGATASNIVFNNIPATYNDLVIYVSARSNRGATEDGLGVQLNNLTSGYTYTNLTGNGFSAASASTNFEQVWANRIPASNSTGNTFSNNYIYIPNYAGSTVKAYMADGVTENNATESYLVMQAISNSTTSAITSITLTSINASFVQHSTATLYGITRVPAGAKATGGVIYDDSSFWYHVFTSSGTFTPSQSITADMLVVGGGGGAGAFAAGGGGAGGVITFTNQALSATNYTVAVGAGGAKSPGDGTQSGDGVNSTFGALTAGRGGGGGGGGSSANFAGKAGGCGGGGGGINSAGGASNQTGTGATNFYGNAGGGGGSYAGSGGGGGGAVGGNGQPNVAQTGVGGIGITSAFINAIAAPVSAGVLSSGNYYFAGGGSGWVSAPSNGGIGGGGGANNNGNGVANTGGGGGSDSVGATGNGGSGIVIVRYAK